MSTLRICGVAVNQTPLDWKANAANITEGIQIAQQNNFELVCFPELSITGYGCQDLFLSSWLIEKALEELLALLPLVKDLYVVVGLPVAFESKLYNCAALLNNGKIIGITPKQHLARDGVHYEPRWFDAWPANKQSEIRVGNDVVPFGDYIYEVKGLRVAFEICEDAWRENRPAHQFVKKGVDLIMNPSASHFAMGKTLERENLVISSSSLFDCTYLYSNLLGNEAGRMIYDGEILIARKGRLLKRNKWLSFKDINVAGVSLQNKNSTDESRPDDYVRDKNEEFVKAVSLALFDYLRKSGSKGFVLSLSGGADSACCAILVREMVSRGIEELGKDIFLSKIKRPDLAGSDQTHIMNGLLSCVYQATRNSTDETFTSARDLAHELGAEFMHWNIDSEVDSTVKKVEEALGEKLSWEKDDITLQNIQARVRSPFVWMLANKKNALLITTSNRSEGDVGYATMDGDTSGSIAPIAGVDKHFIREWLKWAENTLGYKGLGKINQLTPTAELRPRSKKQSDEDDLMPYNILVKIERLAIEKRLSPLEVFENLKKEKNGDPGLLKEYIIRFFRLWSKNQWKRERIAPSFHLDSFNIDPKTWARYPILCHGFEDEIAALNRI